MEGRSFGNFEKKIKKISKFQKCPKSFPKVSKRVLIMLWGNFSEFFLPSAPCRAFQIFWTEEYGFSFPDLKIRVQFSETLLNRHSFCIHATVNVRNPISDFLDLKIWVQIPETKNLRSVFRHKNQQTFFLHSRHSQYTRSHFRFSRAKFMSSDSRTENFEINFPTQKSTNILFALTPQSVYAIPFQIFSS